MKLRGKGLKVLTILILALTLTAQSISPMAPVVAKAAQVAMKPLVVPAAKTLYVGYENYTIKINNLAKGAKVTYESSDKRIASVSVNGVVKPLKQGKSTIKITISQNNKNYTSTLAITVKVPYVTITNQPSETLVGSSYKLVGKSYGIKGGQLTWSSTDTSVATIDKTSGVLNVISAGTTKITLKETNTGVEAHLTITVTKPVTEAYTPPEGSDKAVYLSGLDLSKMSVAYYTTTKEEYIETTRFVLYLDKDVEIPVNVIELINHAMDLIENETGYHFYVKRRNIYDYFGMNLELEEYFDTAEDLKKVNPDHEKVEIVVANHDEAVAAYASGVSGILLGPEHIKLLDENGYVIIHELLHIAWQRNGKYMGSVLAEGFSEYYTTRILEKDEVFNSNYNAYEALKGYENIITEDTIESLFINYTAGSSRYLLGLRIMCYIMEKYDAEAYRRVHDKATELYDGLGEIPMEIVAEAIKSELSKDFFVEFARWYKENHERFGDEDMSAIGDWYIENGYLRKYYGNDKNVVIPESVVNIQPEAFMDNTTLKTVKIPDTVTVIAGGAFFDCTNLKEILIPDSVTIIAVNAFEGCTSLRKVVLPIGIDNLATSVFLGCTALTEITIPEKVKTISENAFSSCSALKTVTLPSNLETIKATAFSDCTSLESIIIPDTVTTVGENIFNGCTSLKNVILSKNTKEIPYGMFCWCRSLQEITLSEGITSIGNFAFCNADLLSVKIPDKVTKIGDSAFYGNKNLKSIEIPKSVKSIGKEVFGECKSLTIYGTSGSYAEKYAKENRYKFVIIK